MNLRQLSSACDFLLYWEWAKRGGLLWAASHSSNCAIDRTSHTLGPSVPQSYTGKHGVFFECEKKAGLTRQRSCPDVDEVLGVTHGTRILPTILASLTVKFRSVSANPWGARQRVLICRVLITYM